MRVWLALGFPAKLPVEGDAVFAQEADLMHGATW